MRTGLRKVFVLKTNFGKTFDIELARQVLLLICSTDFLDIVFFCEGVQLKCIIYYGLLLR